MSSIVKFVLYIHTKKLLDALRGSSPARCNNVHDDAIPCKKPEYNTIPCNAIQYNEMTCNTMQ